MDSCDGANRCINCDGNDIWYDWKQMSMKCH